METKTQGYGTIGWAMSALQYGHKVRRAAWPAGHHATYENEHLQKRGLTTQPLYVGPEDLLAHDWVMLDPIKPGEYHA